MLHLRMKKSVYIYTYGCQMNVHDSEKMLGALSHQGYETAETPEKADLIIFNTCAIRDKAEQKFYSQLGRTKLLKQHKRHLNIAVAGCVAQEEKDNLFRKVPYVDFVLGPQNIHLLNDMVSGRTGRTLIDDNLGIAAMEYESIRNSRVKAWVSIMYGCNNFCSYCIVPYTRGRELSRPSSSIVDEIGDLNEKGYKEVTLLGQNVNSYRSDCTFDELLRKVNDIGIDRIRFVTSHPRDLSYKLVEAMAKLPHLCEHIHLPLQSGSDRILGLMNRQYTLSVYRDKIAMLRKLVPGIAITTDIIAGFPGETDEDHQCTMEALKELEYDGIFAFNYSPRKGTKAYSMKNSVPEPVQSERLSAILRIQEDITHKKNRSLEGTTQEILLEGYSETDKTLRTGRTRTNKIVTIPDCAEPEGARIDVKIVRARLHSLEGVDQNSSLPSFST